MTRIFNFIKRGIRFIKRRGIKGILKKLRGEDLKFSIKMYYGFVVDDTRFDFDIEDYEKHKNDDIKILNWIIPEMGAGSGGHINIFRFISNLENMGFHSRIYIQNPIKFYDDRELAKFLEKNFQILDKRVECFCNCKNATFAHATIATSWQTAYFVKNFNNTISKFYFVQDYEPYFYAVGSEYAFAENTYKFGFRGITAGDWLKNLLHEKYGMQTESFSFSYDKKIYMPYPKEDSVKRVFFYARPVTPRRNFELGLLALSELEKRVGDLQVYLAGWNLDNYEIPFNHRDFGVLSVEELPKIYSQCDMCFILSGTNLSLLPLEVMASNSVAVCSKGQNSEWLVNNENAIIIDYDPIEIANKMAYYLKHPEKLEAIRNKGLKFAQSTSWETEAEKVKDILLKGIAEDDKK